MACAVLAACSPHARVTAARSSGMGIDPFGHTRMSEARDVGAARRAGAHAAAARDAARRPGPLSRSRRRRARRLPQTGRRRPDRFAQALLQVRATSRRTRCISTPERPPRSSTAARRRIRARRRMFTAPITASMDELDRRIPLALGHWHSHRNICVPHKDAPPLTTHAERAPFGFEGTITTRAACDARGRSLPRQRVRLDDARLPVRAHAGRRVLRPENDACFCFVSSCSRRAHQRFGRHQRFADTNNDV